MTIKQAASSNLAAIESLEGPSGISSTSNLQYPLYSLAIEGCDYRGEGNANLVVAIPSVREREREREHILYIPFSLSLLPSLFHCTVTCKFMGWNEVWAWFLLLSAREERKKKLVVFILEHDYCSKVTNETVKEYNDDYYCNTLWDWWPSNFFFFFRVFRSGN